MDHAQDGAGGDSSDDGNGRDTCPVDAGDVVVKLSVGCGAEPELVYHSVDRA
jgi:hypothetical protein